MINSFDQEKLKRISEISIKDQKEGKTEERLKKIDNQNRYDKLVEKYKEEGKSSAWIEELLGKRPETGLEDHNLFKDDLNRIIFFDDFSNLVVEYNDFVGSTDEFLEKLNDDNYFNRFGTENFVDWYEGVKSTKDFVDDYNQLWNTIDKDLEEGKELEL